MTALQVLRDAPYDYATAVSVAVEAADFEREFNCPEESQRYAIALEHLVFSRLRNGHSSPNIDEFGSGTGEPVIQAIRNSRFSGIVHGYEINPDASETAKRHIEESGLAQRYVVHTASFFESKHSQSDYLIANPPYLPCIEADRKRLILSDLCGGKEGTHVSEQLLSSGYLNVFLEVSSYSNPVALIKYAQQRGYRISDFMVVPLEFGVYSNQDFVKERILKMREAGRAFCSDSHYLVGSALFTKGANEKLDLSPNFLAALTSIGRPGARAPIL